MATPLFWDSQRPKDAAANPPPPCLAGTQTSPPTNFIALPSAPRRLYPSIAFVPTGRVVCSRPGLPQPWPRLACLPPDPTESDYDVFCLEGEAVHCCAWLTRTLLPGGLPVCWQVAASRRSLGGRLAAAQT
eukprot:GHVT01094187.1.p1 GENE.GHVT01094187.1~~GHVT01094187.1.p1  ORF type:complete len:131 (-),score=24.71 GHVT01094187.1:35-427(-)